MSRWLWTLAGYALFVIATFYGVLSWLDRQAERRSWKAEKSILQADLAVAKTERRTDSIDVVRWDTAYITIRDSLLVSGKLPPLTVRTVNRMDSLRAACLRCLASASKVERIGDASVQHEAKRPPLPRFAAFGEVHHDVIARDWMLAASGDFRVRDNWLLAARVQRRLVPNDTARLYIGARIGVR